MDKHEQLNRDAARMVGAIESILNQNSNPKPSYWTYQKSMRRDYETSAGLLLVAILVPPCILESYLLLDRLQANGTW
jgi:hypothetical protein